MNTGYFEAVPIAIVYLGITAIILVSIELGLTSISTAVGSCAAMGTGSSKTIARPARIARTIIAHLRVERGCSIESPQN